MPSDLDKEKDYKYLVKAIESLDVKVVVFDSLVRIHSGDENSSKDIAKVMNAFRRITKMGVTVICIHHNRKEGVKMQSTSSIRGSSDILAGIDCLLQVSKPENENYIGINQGKLRQDQQIEPFKVRISLDKEKKSMSFIHDGSFDSDESEMAEAKESIVEILKNNTEKNRQELTEILSENYAITIINKTLKELEASGVILKKVSGHNKHSFCLNTDGHNSGCEIEDKNIL